ncbi:alpha/beta hydrolase [Nocardia bhagyanarayanae]|uniref:Secretory lipase n=1 Tax=Nocardia bhagyanarayanae TaxID=1215925 RepID=A0A543F8L3_9NOCA|nr:lipase family protein [Nocardia bhagyanarayanae]TQM30169.1 secretory lipase [Nocardia bhagyanarayanae]
MRKLCLAAAVTACATALLYPSTANADLATGTVESVAPLAAVATPPDAADAARLLYRSTTAGNAPTTTSAAVYFPAGTPPEGGWPVIAWAHGTVGLGDDCAYSIAGPGARERDWAYLGTWLKQGYAVVAADYAGLGTPGEHPYLNGAVEAHNVVDAVKAATSRYPALAKKWVVVGQSQGGGAAVFTARYATEFGGPDLDYRGAVGTGVPAYIEDILLPLGPGMPPLELNPHSTAYVLYILNGLRTTYPELDIESYLTDAGREWLVRARTVCINEFGDELGAADVVLGDLFARPLAQIPDLRGILTRTMGLPESGYDRPLFLGQGLRDTDVITPATLAFAATLQANGQPVTLRTYDQDHSGAVNASLPDSLPFVRNLFS